MFSRPPTGHTGFCLCDVIIRGKQSTLKIASKLAGFFDATSDMGFKQQSDSNLTK